MKHLTMFPVAAYIIVVPVHVVNGRQYTHVVHSVCTDASIAEIRN